MPEFLPKKPELIYFGRMEWVRKRSYFAFWLGLVAVLAYWYLVRPVGGIGYVEDFCSELSRRAMAENLLKFSAPTFVSDLFMAPFGTPIAFFSWSIERDWLGAYVWMWNREFPFLWVYFAFSLLGSYFVVGAILRRMGLNSVAAWGLAAGVVVLHIPRHFKIWYHIEYLSQHWVYWSLFLDAWIWHRFIREKRWSWNLEIWRGFCLLGVLGSPGYFWGPMVLEWIILRLCFVAVLLLMLHRDQRLAIEGRFRAAILPLSLCVIWAVIEFRWFVPLVTEMKKLGDVWQGLGWFAHLGYVVRPLWLDSVYNLVQSGLALIGLSLPFVLAPVDKPESVVTIGWLFWIPALIGVYLLRRKRGGPGLVAAVPFITLIGIAIAYFGVGGPYFLQEIIQATVPFMKFFRVTCRWGQFLPQLTAILIVLAWPEITAWFRDFAARRSRQALVLIFAAFSLVEISWLLLPVNMLPPLHASTEHLLKNIRQEPGTTVLDLPFCVAGGNGVCTLEQCPNYPKSTTGQCFGNWHEKKVYGIYQARLAESQCDLYRRPPYSSWFHAWADQRCFNEVEWNDFCRYLDERSDLAAILVYPEIWFGAADSDCRARFDAKLGAPQDEGWFYSKSTRGGAGAEPMRVLRYRTKCR